MAKVAKMLEGYKTARLCYEKLGVLLCGFINLYDILF